MKISLKPRTRQGANQYPKSNTVKSYKTRSSTCFAKSASLWQSSWSTASCSRASFSPLTSFPYYFATRSARSSTNMPFPQSCQAGTFTSPYQKTKKKTSLRMRIPEPELRANGGDSIREFSKKQIISML